MQGFFGSRVASMADGEAQVSDGSQAATDVAITSGDPPPRVGTGSDNISGEIHRESQQAPHDEVTARLAEMRDWHTGKASASWSYETKERHERFAQWLGDLEKQFQDD